MHLVGYLYEGYHDVRSLEHKVSCQRNNGVLTKVCTKLVLPIFFSFKCGAGVHFLAFPIS
jgi:hypothetical protein